MTLTLGSRPTDTPLTEATPGETVCGFRMANVAYPDGEKRYAPMMIVYVHPQDAAPADLFEAVGL